ncbi:MAG: ABC transporter substrate-binding protein, partial [Treponema sp.]|nr:ABC transporter substrate-binding protein [Treponema sp.]
MKKIGLLFITLSLVIPGTLFAAGGQQQSGGPVTLTFWTHEDPNRTRIEERYIQEFEAANPNIKIERT